MTEPTHPSETEAQKAEREAHEALDTAFNQIRWNDARPSAHAAITRALEARDRQAREEEAEACRLAQCAGCRQGIPAGFHKEDDGYLWWTHGEAEHTERCKAEGIRRRNEERRRG